MGAYDNQRGIEALQRAALAAIPFERIETTGENALNTWLRLRDEGRGWPVVAGDDDQLSWMIHRWANLAEPRGPDEILSRAETLNYPASLETLPGRPQLSAGEWLPPQDPSQGPLSIVRELDGEPKSKANILLVPTEESSAVPAFLRWGDFKEAPSAEHHVAALRSWKQRYGAELIGMTGHELNLRVQHRPRTRDAALALAGEHGRYCPCLIEAHGGLAQYASSLLVDTWWWFAWM